MNIPEYLHDRVAQLIAIETQAVIYKEITEERKSRWAVILGLIPQRDGDQWCILWGIDLQNGVSSFGSTPEEAVLNFDIEMKKNLKS